LLGARLSAGEVVELVSDLGGGKTTFVRGLARGLGSADTVASPTFVLSRIYHGRAGRKLYHYDFYRLSEPGVLADQLAEALADPKGIIVIEWAKQLQKGLPAERWVVKFEPLPEDSDQRRIVIEYPPTAVGLVDQLESDWQTVKA